MRMDYGGRPSYMLLIAGKLPPPRDEISTLPGMVGALACVVPTMTETNPAPVGAARTTRKAKTPPEIYIKISWCKGCGLCVDYCNRGVLEMKDALPRVVQAERCTSCLQCEDICPDFAIEIREAGAAPQDGGDA